MKTILSLILAVGFGANGFAQTTDQMAFQNEPIEVQAKLVSQSLQEVEALTKSLSLANTKKGVAFALAITSSSVSVISLFMAGSSFLVRKTMSSDLRETFSVITGVALATSGATAYGAYKSFQWYEIKASEVEQLLRDLNRARMSLRAADRTYKILLSSG